MGAAWANPERWRRGPPLRQIPSPALVLLLLAACVGPGASQDMKSTSLASSTTSPPAATSLPAATASPAAGTSLAPPGVGTVTADSNNATTTPAQPSPSPATTPAAQSPATASPPPAPSPAASPQQQEKSPAQAATPVPSPTSEASPSPSLSPFTSPDPSPSPLPVASPLPSPVVSTPVVSPTAPLASTNPTFTAASPAATPSPAAATGSETLSLVLSLAGNNLAPWTATKSIQTLVALTGVLSQGGVTVNGTSTALLRVQGNSTSGGKRRRRLTDTSTGTDPSVVAPIPSLYSIMETALVRATVQAPQGSQTAIQSVLVAATASGQLATTLRLRGLMVSQAQLMAMYQGAANPANLTALTPLTVNNASATASPSPSTGFAASSSGGLETWEILVIVGTLLGAVAVTGALLWWFWRRRLAAAAARSGSSFGYDGKDVKKSPTPVRRTQSAASVDLEASYTPRYRQPFTPRRSALKQQAGFGATMSMHATAAGGCTTQLASGVQLMPRAPGQGARMPISVACTMAAVQGLQEARRAEALASVFASQQAAEQTAMREYLKSKPMQVMWEDEAEARVARVAEQLARSQSRLRSLPSSSRPSSFTTADGSTRAPSEASYASSEIVPADGGVLVPTSLYSACSGRSTHSVAPLPGRYSVDGGGAALPEQLKRAAARVQSGSPRRSSARARGAFAVKEVEGALGQATSRLGRISSSGQGEVPAATLPTDRNQLTGAWVASGGHVKPSQVVPEVADEGHD